MSKETKSQMRWIVATVIAMGALPVFAQDTAEARDDEQPDPYEWVTESYSFPSMRLIYGFASEERGELRAPTMPGDDATDEEIRNFIKKSNSIISHYLEREGLSLPEGVLAIFDAESLTLTARAPRIVQSSLSFVADSFQSSTEKYITMETTILQGPADPVGKIADRAGDQADHTSLQEELMAVEGVELIDTSYVELRSGNRSKIESGAEVYFPSDLVLMEDDSVEYSSEAMDTGTQWEFDSVLGADEITIDLNLGFHHDLAPPTRRMIGVARRGDSTISTAVTDSRTATITSQYTFHSGATKFLGMWNPSAGLENPPNPDLRQTAFIRATAVRNLPVIEERLTTMLNDHGDAVAPVPEGKPKFKQEAEEIPEGMIVRRFVIPPTFLSTGGGAGGGNAADPFAAPIRSEPTFSVRVTAKDILRSGGIPFPEGSSANYLRASSTLVVRNTPENIQLVEAYVMSIVGGVEKSIGATLYVIQGPAELVRETVKKSRGLANHENQWKEIRSAQGTEVLETIWLEGRSGQRAKVEAGRTFGFPTGIYWEKNSAENEEKEEDGKAKRGELVPETDSAHVGVSLEFDPVLGADEWTIDINYAFKYDYAPPTTEEVPPVVGDAGIQMEGPSTTFHQANIATQSTFRSGAIRMIGYWKPEGKPEFANGDIMQAAFLRLKVIPVVDDAEAVEGR